MQKFFLKYTGIIFLNLFAFLSVGHILDVLFGAGSKYKVIFLILSIIPLLVFGTLLIKKTLQDLERIPDKKTDGGTTNDHHPTR